MTVCVKEWRCDNQNDAVDSRCKVIGIQTAHANNVVVDMSQVQDYNQYQLDLQQ